MHAQLQQFVGNRVVVKRHPDLRQVTGLICHLSLTVEHVAQSLCTGIARVSSQLSRAQDAASRSREFSHAGALIRALRASLRFIAMNSGTFTGTLGMNGPNSPCDFKRKPG